MIDVRQFRKVSVQYLSDGNIDAFVLKFGELSHDIHLSGDANAIGFSRKVRSRLNDLRLGCASRLEFNKELLDLLSLYPATYAAPVDSYWFLADHDLMEIGCVPSFEVIDDALSTRSQPMVVTANAA